MARYSLLPSVAWRYKKQNPEDLYDEVRGWGATIVNELELRDQQVDATPSTNIYAVVTVTEIGRPKSGDIAYSASSGQYLGYVSSGATAEWQVLNGGSGAGYFLGSGAATGDTTDGLNDIFRVNTVSLANDTTIASSTNASCVGPLSVASSITLTVNGTLVII
tara:strand:+ start:733 stop:1221 length:489 start_codon:yes stop_codon:yes gene_type:complete